MLRVVQGHPKLMELADAAAADRDRLDAQLAAAEEAAAGQGLDAFFRDGDSTLDPDQFLDALTGWTVTALGVLPPQARLMARVRGLPGGRRPDSDVIEANWADLWRRLDSRSEHGPGSTPAAPRAGDHGDPPEPGPLLEALAAAALVEAGTGCDACCGRRAPPGDGPGPVAYRVHPGVAAAISAAAGPESARPPTPSWPRSGRRSPTGAGAGGRGGQRPGGAGGAGRRPVPAAPRRLGHRRHPARARHPCGTGRRGWWRRCCPRCAGSPPPPARPWTPVVLARALRRRGPRARPSGCCADALAAAGAAGDYRSPPVIAGDLVNLLRRGRAAGGGAGGGRADGRSTRERAGLGPWTQLADQAQRLQVLARMGEHERVLAETERAARRRWPAARPPGAATRPSIRGMSARPSWTPAGLGAGAGPWQRCLDLNAEITASKRQRGAGLHELTRYPVQ